MYISVKYTCKIQLAPVRVNSFSFLGSRGLHLKFLDLVISWTFSVSSQWTDTSDLDLNPHDVYKLCLVTSILSTKKNKKKTPGLLFATCTLSQPVTVKIKLRTLLSTEINSVMLPHVQLLSLGCTLLNKPLCTARHRGSCAVCAGYKDRLSEWMCKSNWHTWREKHP